MGSIQQEAKAALAEAERMRERSSKAVRWFSRYLVGAGILMIGVVVGLEALFPDSPGRYLVLGVWGAMVGASGSWWDRRAAVPLRAKRRLFIATGAWLVLYAWLLGPLVRWQFGESLLPWTVAGALMATPFFVAAFWKVRA
ncbi:hypothetical protein HNR23_004837 [Nocardiopsis mwathae]|uniref:Transmembrane protein n=1 Tax=Nocardiopsis mwathae TaxID=1472723 RepID=A0A7W9YMA5_9ACTN|nr:hypothetical protein [Nocardiopsis mwathae]MBB6174777.1 hypothetical protein [Nocardiopsis mwathae]